MFLSAPWINGWVNNREAKGIKTGSGWVCCHNARGRVRNRKPNSEADRPMDLTYCSHKPECIVTTNPDKSVLISIIAWHFQFHLVNVSILQLKYEYGARIESCSSLSSDCYVTWYPLTTGIGASQCPSERDTALVTCYLTLLIGVFKSVDNNCTTITHIYNESVNIIEGSNVAFNEVIAWISHKRCQWLEMRV